MGRLLLSVAIGLVGAAIVHIAVIFAMPELAQHNAWGRFSGLGNPYDLVKVDPLRSAGPQTDGVLPRPDHQAFAFVDPAFVTASCRFSLANGPVRISAGASPTTFWSTSIYDRQGDNLYSINERSAIDGVVNLLVGTRNQIIDAMADPSADSDDTSIPVEVNMSEGYMTIRVLVDEESKRPLVEDFVSSLSCEPAATASAQRRPGGVQPAT